MNSIWILVIMIVVLLLGYFFYGKFFEKRIIEADKDRVTPAHRLNDKMDYYPSKTIMLFGHHFSSIAGAGPIIGPLVAIINFGWLAAIGWLAIGSIFIGAVHDYLTLMISVRNDGKSIASIAEQVMGKKAKIIFSIFLWLALVLVIAVFGIVSAKTLVVKPTIVVPTFSLIIIAIIVGFMVYRMKLPVFAATLVGLILLIYAVFLGFKFPIAFNMSAAKATMTWFWILMLYAGIASVVPVWILLQPRDYISTYILWTGLFLGIVGIFVAAKHINAPAFYQFHSPKQGPMWPMLFILVACGAISGFHALVAGGTTSKQLGNEKTGLVIGYGAMLTETLLAVVAAISVSAGLYWIKAPTPALQHLVFQKVYEQGWIVAFSTGYANIIQTLPVITFTIAMAFAMLMLNSFVLTTLDTTTRLSRFIFSETLGEYGKFWRNKIIATLPAIALAAYFGYTNSWKTIWPIFGASNQLVAALVLVIISTYLVGIKKPSIYTALPAAFMLITTVAALIYKIYTFVYAYNPQKGPQYGLAIIGVVLIILAVIITIEAIKIYSALAKRKAAELSAEAK